MVLVLLLLLGACTARYVSLGPDAHHRFSIGAGQFRDMPLVSPTLLGWIVPGEQTRVDGAQFTPDGRWLYLSSSRGVGDQLASATLSRPTEGELSVELRLIQIPSPGRSAIGLFFGTRIWLDKPVDSGHPPRIIDASTGDPVAVEPYLP